jgi:hypothetical protein
MKLQLNGTPNQVFIKQKEFILTIQFTGMILDNLALTLRSSTVLKTMGCRALPAGR